MAKQQLIMFCKNCGRENPSYAKFCIRCGYKQDEPDKKQVCPPTFLVQSILVTLFCCLPFGIVGIINAARVSSYFAGERYEEAEQASKKASNYTLIGCILGVILWVISFALTDLYHVL